MKTKPMLLLTLLLLSVLLSREAQAFYNPQTGRWLSRDPVLEVGFNTSRLRGGRTPQVHGRQGPLADSHVMAANNTLSRWDYLGLEDVSPNLPCPASEDGMSWNGKAGFGGLMRCQYKQCNFGDTSYSTEGTYGAEVISDEHWEEGLGCLQSKCRTYTEALYALTGCGCRYRTVYYQLIPPARLGTRVKQDDSIEPSVRKTLVGGPWSGTSCSEGLVDKTQEDCGRH